MKHTLFAFLAVGFSLAAMTTPEPAEARQVYSGQDLILNCKDPVICDVFLAALLDSQSTLVGWYQVPATVCPPVDLGMNLIWGLVRAHYDRNEGELAKSAGSLALIALESAVPCGEAVSPAEAVMPRFRTGIDLVVTCANPLVCEAFLIGVMDGHQTLVDWNRIRPLVCLPEEIANSDLMLATLNYLEAHGDQLNYSAASLVLLALSEAYGCM